MALIFDKYTVHPHHLELALCNQEEVYSSRLHQLLLDFATLLSYYGNQGFLLRFLIARNLVLLRLLLLDGEHFLKLRI